MEAGGSLLGRYRLRARLGAGGMAEVFRAWQELPGGLRRGVVIKKIRPERLRAPGEAARFREEARVSLGLNHPHIVGYIGCCTDWPHLIIVTEYLPGGNIFDLLYQDNKFVPAEVRLRMALQLVSYC